MNTDNDNDNDNEETDWFAESKDYEIDRVIQALDQLDRERALKNLPPARYVDI